MRRRKSVSMNLFEAFVIPRTIFYTPLTCSFIIASKLTYPKCANQLFANSDSDHFVSYYLQNFSKLCLPFFFQICCLGRFAACYFLKKTHFHHLTLLWRCNLLVLIDSKVRNNVTADDDGWRFGLDVNINTEPLEFGIRIWVGLCWLVVSLSDRDGGMVGKYFPSSDAVISRTDKH